jgi:hypothetical protein
MLVAILVGSAVLSVSPAAFAAGSDQQQLTIDMQTQQYDEWCWAASGVTIANYEGHPVEQNEFCKLAHNENGETCTNNPAYLEEVSNGFKKLGFNNPGTVRKDLTFDQVRAEIDADRPMESSIQWTAGGGHAEVIYGYDATDGTISFGDPWPDDQRYNTMTFADYRSNSEFTWNYTLAGIEG